MQIGKKGKFTKGKEKLKKGKEKKLRPFSKLCSCEALKSGVFQSTAN
jgi:hypothetical protein